MNSGAPNIKLSNRNKKIHVFIPLLTAFYTTQNTKIDIEQHDPHLEMLEDTKGVIRSRKSKDGQKQWAKEKRHTIMYKTLQKKLKIEQHELY